MPTTYGTLARDGGPKAITHPAPTSYLHGPQEIGAEEIAAVTATLENKNLFRFDKPRKVSPTAQLEDYFSELSGAKHVLAVNSGTSALICAMVGLGLEPGDEVLVPAYTYIATAAAALAVGAFPVVVDIDESLTMDPTDIERKITPRTRLIVPVHMRGTPCRMDAIMKVANCHGIRVLEDTAQANGGFYRGKALGTWGHAGIFSLQHFKIVTAGEGGLVVTSDREVYERAACWHDSAYTFWMERNGIGIAPFLGENYRMSEINGALGLAQMRKRDGILSRLRAIKSRLLEQLADLPGIRFQDVPDPAGDCAISLVILLDDATKTAAYAAALRSEGMYAGSIFDKGLPDRHIYYHWDYIMAQRTPFASGYPWRNGPQPCHVCYSRDACPQALAILQCCVVLSLTQTMTDAYVDDCVIALRKVHMAMCDGML